VGLVYNLQLCRVDPMKDPYIVLYQKEQDVEHVRLEIRALVIVIPLLIDNETASGTQPPVM
jgi:hypothetical protein